MPERRTPGSRSDCKPLHPPARPLWSVYIVRCGDDSLYTGIATNVSRRLNEHEAGVLGAKYLRGRAPFELIFEQQVGDRSLASKIEYRIKKLARRDKEKVVDLPARVSQMIVDCTSSQADSTCQQTRINTRRQEGRKAAAE